MTAFCLQEFIISGVYMYSTIKLLRPVYHGRTRKVMMLQIWTNLIVIAMDIGLLAMEYSRNYDIEATAKSMFYSIKLKLEFAVLNQLMSLANSSVKHAQQIHISGDDGGSPIDVEKEKPESHWARYLSHRRSDKRPKHRTANKSRRSRSASNVAANAHSSAPIGPQGRVKWIPPLDRNRIVETTHIENVSAPADEFTNPAACFPSGKDHRFSHDRLSSISNCPPASPTLTGTTLDPISHPYNRRPPASHLDLGGSPVLADGVFRSSRPSVADWSPSTDSECSPKADDMAISPYDVSLTPKKSLGSVKAGRGRAEKSMGMNFMTSALHERP